MMAAIENNIQKKDPDSTKIHFRWILILCLIFCQLILYTWLRTESTQAIFRISSLKQSLAEKTTYHKQMRLEEERLRSDQRITHIAKTKLNLSGNPVKQTIYFSEASGS